MTPQHATRWVANLTMIYPLVPAGLLYAQWYLSWYMLGHEPVPSADDPKFIPVAGWVHYATSAALMGAMILAPGAIISNVAYIIQSRPTAVQAGLRLQTLVAVWLGVAVAMYWDPKMATIWQWWSD